MRRLLLVLALAACASAPKPQPQLWNVCRDACALHEAGWAAVVGSVDPREAPRCLCAPKLEET